MPQPVAEQLNTKPQTQSRLRRILLRVVVSTVIFAAVAVVGLYGATVYLLNKSFTHRVVKLKYTPEALGLKGESVDLTSSDSIPLKGWWVPAEQSRGTVLVLHGMDGLDASSLLPHARFLHDAGWSAFVLDMRAHGRSGGKRIGLSLEEPRDISAALDWLGRQPLVKDKPLVLLGLSMGGASAIRTAAIRPDVDAVVSVSAFASLEPMMGTGPQLWFARLGILTLYGAWTPNTAPVRDIARISPRPILLIHGTADTQIAVDNAYALKTAAGPGVQLWIVPGADHLVFTKDGNSEEPGDTEYRKHILEFMAGVKHRA